MTTDKLGLYVHIPLCVRKCNYCDFCSYPSSGAEWRDSYVDTLVSEIDSYGGRGLSVDTVFFGGGTPSLLSPYEFDKICAHINSAFSVSPEAEFTIEANPKTLSLQNLMAYKSCGVNRVSMGVQSVCENELKFLGRIHNRADALESYKLLRTAGIENVNLDLMYGIPGQSIDSFSKTLDDILSLSPEHISLYGLILEEGTPFWKMRDRLPLPSEDTECDMYYMARDRLSAYGYSHYEISNYAKRGYECRHNLKYWRCDEYIGVGVSAYSYFDGYRFGNSSDINEYLAVEREKYKYREEIDEQARAYEFVMLALRLSEGFSLAEYENEFGEAFINESRGTKIKELAELGYIRLDYDRISLTDKGFYISNRILTDLL